jgi:hypothetical protein
MQKIIAILLPVFFLAACHWPGSKPELVPVPESSQNCAFVWATRPLPELSEQFQKALNAVGLEGVTATANAYGENCNDAKTNQPVSFGTLETDFHIAVKVADLADKDNLGNLLEKILRVLAAIPTDKIPGPEPGYINISFQAGNDELNISFNVTEGKSALASGQHGGVLFEELQKK